MGFNKESFLGLLALEHSLKELGIESSGDAWIINSLPASNVSSLVICGRSTVLHLSGKDSMQVNSIFRVLSWVSGCISLIWLPSMLRNSNPTQFPFLIGLMLINRLLPSSEKAYLIADIQGEAFPSCRPLPLIRCAGAQGGGSSVEAVGKVTAHSAADSGRAWWLSWDFQPSKLKTQETSRCSLWGRLPRFAMKPAHSCCWASPARPKWLAVWARSLVPPDLVPCNIIIFMCVIIIISEFAPWSLLTDWLKNVRAMRIIVMNGWRCRWIGRLLPFWRVGIPLYL